MMSAETGAHRGQHLVRDIAAIARVEAIPQRRGEGRHRNAFVDRRVNGPATLAASLWDRFYSRDRGDVAHKVLSAMRSGFGGHHEVKAVKAKAQK